MSNMKKVMAGTLKKLMWYYSGHDSTILNMQVAYGVNRTDVVNPVKVGSGLILELHKNSTTSEYFIQVALNRACCNIRYHDTYVPRIVYE